MTTKTVRVKALTFHTFAGKEYKPGDTYEVEGDSTQSADQYAATLGALRFATLDIGRSKKADKADDEGADQKGEYATRDMQAAKR